MLQFLAILLFFYGPIVLLLVIVVALLRKFKPNADFGDVLAWWIPLALAYVAALALFSNP